MEIPEFFLVAFSLFIHTAKLVTQILMSSACSYVCFTFTCNVVTYFHGSHKCIFIFRFEFCMYICCYYW